LLIDEHEMVRLKAATALGNLAEIEIGDVSSITGLNHLMRDQEADVREAAAMAICNLAAKGIGISSSIHGLNGLLMDPKWEIQLSALMAIDELAMIGIGNVSSLEPLTQLLHEDNVVIRRQALICVYSIAKYLEIGDAEAIPWINHLLADDDSVIRLFSAMSILEMAVWRIADPSSIAPLEALLSDQINDVAQAAANAIGSLALHLRIGERTSIPLLNRRLEGDRNECSRSAFALGWLAWIGLGDKASIGPLNRMMSSTNVYSVTMATMAIGNLARIGIGDSSSLEHLGTILGTHKNDQISIFAENALKYLTAMNSVP
jgi:HEAT repeat protein